MFNPKDTNTPIRREMLRLDMEERRYLRKRQEAKGNPLNNLLEEKVPETLQSTLDNAFAAAFSMIFKYGTGVIEKTYNKEKLTEDNQVGRDRILRLRDRRSLRDVTEKAEVSGLKNTILSGAAGIGMGAVGAGLPDIPLFTAMLLKSIYEIALQYGFPYDSDEEQYFILLLIEGAVADWEQLQEIEEKLDIYMDTLLLPKYYSKDGQICTAAAGLSKELLYMKFLQGTPVVGIIGGVYDVIYLRKITEYAELKYRRRFYNKMLSEK